MTYFICTVCQHQWGEAHDPPRDYVGVFNHVEYLEPNWHQGARYNYSTDSERNFMRCPCCRSNRVTFKPEETPHSSDKEQSHGTIS